MGHAHKDNNDSKKLKSSAAASPRAVQHPADADESPLMEMASGIGQMTLSKDSAPDKDKIVHAPSLPAHLRSKISLAPTESSRKAPAEQELGLRHGKSYLLSG
jgi:hypothetical protein